MKSVVFGFAVHATDWERTLFLSDLSDFYDLDPAKVGRLEYRFDVRDSRWTHVREFVEHQQRAGLRYRLDI